MPWQSLRKHNKHTHYFQMLKQFQNEYLILVSLVDFPDLKIFSEGIYVISAIILRTGNMDIRS